MIDEVSPIIIRRLKKKPPSLQVNSSLFFSLFHLLINCRMVNVLLLGVFGLGVWFLNTKC